MITSPESKSKRTSSGGPTRSSSGPRGGTDLPGVTRLYQAPDPRREPSPLCLRLLRTRTSVSYGLGRPLARGTTPRGTTGTGEALGRQQYWGSRSHCKPWWLGRWLGYKDSQGSQRETVLWAHLPNQPGHSGLEGRSLPGRIAAMGSQRPLEEVWGKTSALNPTLLPMGAVGVGTLTSVSGRGMNTGGAIFRLSP